MIGWICADSCLVGQFEHDLHLEILRAIAAAVDDRLTRTSGISRKTGGLTWLAAAAASALAGEEEVIGAAADRAERDEPARRHQDELERKLALGGGGFAFLAFGFGFVGFGLRFVLSLPSPLPLA